MERIGKYLLIGIAIGVVTTLVFPMVLFMAFLVLAAVGVFAIARKLVPIEPKDEKQPPLRNVTGQSTRARYTFDQD